MGNLGKRFRAYAGPVLLVYTVLVTWLLISTAWNDHDLDVNLLRGSRGGRSTREGQQDLESDTPGKSFLDVIVQEERRHMKSFKNAVRSYRDAFDEDDKVSNDKKTDQDKDSVDSEKSQKNKQDRQSKRRNAATKDVPAKSRSRKRKIKPNNHNTAKEQPGKEGNLKPHFKPVENHKRTNSGSVVEVEEWDPKQGKDSRKTQNSRPNAKKSKTEPNSKDKAGADIKIESKLEPTKSSVNQNQSLKLQEPDQFVKFCDQVFEDPNIVPNICNRPARESSNKNHIQVHNVSEGFQRVGEIKIYSTFLDTRQGQPFIRTITLAPSVQKNGPSIYWCVFHNFTTNLSTGDTDKLSNGASKKSSKSRAFAKDSKYRHSEEISEGQQRTSVLGATVLSFYAASDGHGKDNRFYIASCPLIQKAYHLFSRADKLAQIQIIVGSFETAFLGAEQQNVFMDVIVNRPIETLTKRSISEPVQSFGKTLLVDVKAPGAKKSIEDLDIEALKSQIAKNASLGNNGLNRKITSVFELDDDDEDKEISREKKHHSPNKLKSKPSPDGSITIPLQLVKTVGETIVSCVSPLHGKVNSMQIIEFVELSLLLGVQHIVFYLPSSAQLDDARKAIRMYESRGLITSLPWDLPAPAERNPNNVTEDVWARGRDVALNDCLYRTVYKFDWALFLDLDEFFVPRVTPDLPSFLRYLTDQHNFNASRITDLVFPSTYFPPPTRTQYKNLTTTKGFHQDVNKFSSLKSVHRTYFDQKQTLRMLRPETAARVGAGERKRTSYHLSHRYASVHHYSFCPRGEADGKGTGGKSQSGVSCSHLKADWTMWRFKSLLLDRGKSAVAILDKG